MKNYSPSNKFLTALFFLNEQPPLLKNILNFLISSSQFNFRKTPKLSGNTQDPECGWNGLTKATRCRHPSTWSITPCMGVFYLLTKFLGNSEKNAVVVVVMG